CGAQAAAVSQSVFLSASLEEPEVPSLADLAIAFHSNVEPNPKPEAPRPYPPGFLPENFQLLLLGEKSVQQELQLSGAEVKEVTRLAGVRGALRAAGRQLGRDDWNARVRQLLTEEKAALDDLDTDQAERLRQIDWQQRGPLAYADAEVGEAL